MNINISLNLSPDYKNDFVDIQKKDYSLNFKLQDGKHKISTPLMEIGQLLYFNNTTLLAELNFYYEFDAAKKLLTINGTNYSSSESMTLLTFPKGTDEFHYQRSFDSEIENNSMLSNPNWNFNTPMTPRLDAIFSTIVKTATDALIQAAQELNEITIQVRTAPPKLSPEEHLNFSLVYKAGKFVELYDSKKNYGADFTLKSLQSVWGGTVTFFPGEIFSNVIGSTPDPEIGGKSWLQLWKNQFGITKTCTSYQYRNFPCDCDREELVGGHIALGIQASVKPAGSNSVYIIPICSAHQKNNGVYMAALKNFHGIWLNNYLH